MAKLYLVLVFAATLASAFAAPAYAAGMTQLSSGKSLSVVLDPQIGQDGSGNIKVSFMKPGSQTVQQHIDYDVIVKDGSGKEVFSASKLANQPSPLHTAEGVVTIPAKLPSSGGYKVTVEIYGILFNPIKTEN